MTFTITTDSNSIKDANNYNTVEKYNDRVDLERGGNAQGKLSGGESLMRQLSPWLEKFILGQSPLPCVAHF